MPHLLRPHEDWAPVVCSVGTAHSAPQWQSLLLALASDSVRPTDGFLFKSRAAQALFREVWGDWQQRLGLGTGFPEATVVIPNGVDVEANQTLAQAAGRDPARPAAARGGRRFSLLLSAEPRNQGRSARPSSCAGRRSSEKSPDALLLLAGAQVDRAFTMEQRQLARAAGVADRVVILENPFELLADARSGLMSAADVFVHLTTGVEEASPLVIREAMAHSLPVIASRWAGVPEIVAHGQDGFLVGTLAAPVPATLTGATFGVSDLPVGLGASRSVACDFDDFVRGALALCQPELRRAMAAAARRNAESNTSEMVARSTVHFFRQTSLRAQEGWPPARRFRPLVDLDRVLAAQTIGSLQASDRVVLARVDRAPLLTEGWQPEDPTQVRMVLAAFDGQPELELGALAAAVLGPGAPLRSASRLIVRLLNYGVIRLVAPIS